MAEKSQSWLRTVLRGLRPSSGDAAAFDVKFKKLDRRLDRIERKLDSLDKIWLRTRHVEPAVQAVLRSQYLDADSLPYPERLIAKRFRLSSQNQEDGITAALLADAGIVTRRFVEIGSGLSGGNSAFLAHEWGWAGLMVDGDKPRMEQVGRRFPSVTSVGAWVTRENLNDLIASNGFSGEIDFFSLDLDGIDYWAWESMTACSPRVVVLEYNSMFGPDRAVTVPYDPQFSRDRYHTMYYGASLAALTRLSATKGYRLVAGEPAGVNAFFLRNDLAPQIPACEPRRAFHVLEKHDVLMRQGQDVFRYAADAGLALVEVP